MSYETWAAEYYPVPADQVPPGEAVAHSLRKWEGLRAGVLEEHDLRRISWGDVADRYGGTKLVIAADSCALCHQFARPKCVRCPLAIARAVDGAPVACDKSRPDEPLSPWTFWTRFGDPAPMIMWLQKAKEN